MPPAARRVGHSIARAAGGTNGRFLELFGTRVPGSVALRQRLKSLISGTKGQVTRGDFARGLGTVSTGTEGFS